MLYSVTLNPAVDRELTVPEIAFDEVLRASASRVDYGGKGFNVSRMWAALGATSVALGIAGGRSGQLLAEGLAGLGIATDFLWIPGETRTNVSIVAADHSRYIKVNEAGPAIDAPAYQALLDKVTGLARAGDWWVLAGSLPPGAPVTAYADLIHIIQNAGGHAVLDASGEALARGCQAGPHLVKPNAVEAEALTGRPVETMDDALAAASRIRAGGVGAAVISMGASGAVMATKTGVWQASPPPIRERNPIGAGDSMVAGLVWRLAQGAPPEDALRWGMACGAATAATSGTGMGSLEEITALVGHTSLRDDSR
jgi:1-phosphofructokinase family hexose kinase